MTQEDSGLFQVRLTEEGKNYIRKFAVISYSMMVLVLFVSSVSVYWSIRSIVRMNNSDYPGFPLTLYDKIFPYVTLVFAFLSLASNYLYLRFPRELSNSITLKDEYGANRSFRLLFRGALF